MVAGTLTAGEVLERLTTAPPAGAGPCRSTQAMAGEPPLSATGVARMSFITVGSTVNWPEVEAPLIVAVIVTGVGAVTCPSGSWNCVHPMLPGIVIVAGTGA